jgi:RimJ/RimL family protein N-acetyltransferase
MVGNLPIERGLLAADARSTTGAGYPERICTMAAGRRPEELLTGQLVHLRAPLASDAEAARAAVHDAATQRFASAIGLPSLDAVVDPARSELWPPGPRFTIETPAHAVTGIMLVLELDERHGRFGYQVLVFPSFRRRGYAADAILVLLRHYFGQRDYERCEVRIPDFNEPALQLHGRLGFTEEGRPRSSIRVGDRRWDELLLGMTATEFAELHGDSLGSSAGGSA